MPLPRPHTALRRSFLPTARLTALSPSQIPQTPRTHRPINSTSPTPNANAHNTHNLTNTHNNNNNNNTHNDRITQEHLARARITLDTISDPSRLAHRRILARFRALHPSPLHSLPPPSLGPVPSSIPSLMHAPKHGSLGHSHATPSRANANAVLRQQLLDTGAHLGHAAKYWRPAHRPYTHATRHSSVLFDLDQTLLSIKRACTLITSIARSQGLILFIDHLPLPSSALAIPLRQLPPQTVAVVPGRWVPGTLTNAAQVLPSTNTSNKPSSAVQPKPDLAILLAPKTQATALQECTDARIPTIAITDSDLDPRLVTYPIPANDDSQRFKQLVCSLFTQAALQGLAERNAPPVVKTPAANTSTQPSSTTARHHRRYNNPQRQLAA